MRNRKKHERKFLREWREEDLKNPTKQPWCTRAGAKSVIDDLTDEEFEVVTDVLAHLYLLNERFPAEKDHRKVRRNVARFLQGKTIQKVAWLGWPDEGPMLCLDFTDGLSLETYNFIRVPGAIGYVCEGGTNDKSDKAVKKLKRRDGEAARLQRSRHSLWYIHECTECHHVWRAPRQIPTCLSCNGTRINVKAEPPKELLG